MHKSKEFILWFDQTGIEDVPLVGGKNASLGEMYKNLSSKGINVPNGFSVTAYAYKYILEKAGIEDEIKDVLSDLNVHDLANLAERGRKVRELIRNCHFPSELKVAIMAAYHKLCGQYSKNTDVAVRSSATAEDLPTASFAGQQETYLNIKGEHQLIEACKDCFASLFTNRAISYRVDKGFDHFKVYLSIGVQKMVRSDLSSSGVMFSIDTESGFRDVVFITGAYGLGENVVQGAVNPDEYYVFKPTLKKGFKPILVRTVGDKKIKMIYTEEGNKTTKNVVVPDSERKKLVINDDEVLTLAKWAVIIEDHYSKKAGHPKPMDMEWAKDGKTGQLFIVQARPETVQSQKSANILQNYHLNQKGRIIAQGRSVGDRIGQGTAHIIKDVKDIAHFKKGEVLVTEMTDPDWEPIMKIASAIVTNKGGRTCFSGDTKLLTNEGFRTFKEVFEDYEGLKVPSLNRKSLKVEWKPVIASMRKRGNLIRVATSQTGRAGSNTLDITPNHKMISLAEGELCDKEIKDILQDNEMLTLIQNLPAVNTSSEKEQKMAYLMGAISTDGSVYTSRTHGEVQFIQKPTKEKKEFISTVCDYAVDVFGKGFTEMKKNPSVGFIRGNPVSGSANAYRLYSKQIAYAVKNQQQQLVQTMLNADKEVIHYFLAGVIDGDGTFQRSRIQIYISKEHLCQAVVIACLRLGIVPQVTNNRSIYNIQIVEKVDNILKYAKRVKGTHKRDTFATRFFGARHLFDKDKIVGEQKLRYQKNLLISEKDLDKSKFKKIIDSDLRQQRVNLKENLGEDYVYNITVEDNHNYAVFSEQYSPIIVNNCHAAIISRELGIPCIVGTNDGTEKIRNGQKITASCAEGEVGNIYDGLLKFEIKEIDLKKMPETKTKVMMNVGNPYEAFEFSFKPNSGVGLAREEFIINSYIKIHPRALIEFNKLKDKSIKAKIEKLTPNYKDKKQFFIDKLAEGISMIAAAFYPKKVIVRMSDFKSNEYANLIGGKAYEPKEDNPMIGWRGASRYYSENYREAFALECKAMKKVRDEMGLTNMRLMIPFCRTVEEGKKVLAEMAKNGLKQGENGLEVYAMCEIPSNVILAEEFLKVFDGFSIGTNDLTQLTLGLDRDSELVAPIYDERNEAVKTLVKRVIEVCNKKKKYIGICGQAPSDYPEFAQFLVRCGIESISLNPDSVVKTTLAIAEMEQKLRKQKKR